MTYSIGELAAIAGVNVETIRFYERRGLARAGAHGERIPEKPNLANK